MDYIPPMPKGYEFGQWHLRKYRNCTKDRMVIVCFAGVLVPIMLDETTMTWTECFAR